MKSIARPSFYFSAYPLKAIKTSAPAEPTGSPYLKALLSGKTKTAAAPRARVFAMTNPYSRPYKPAPLRTALRGDKLPNDIELTEKGWFNHYE